MYVATAGGEALVPADDSLPRGREEHRAATLDYLFVD
jgi:hypothetical protein